MISYRESLDGIEASQLSGGFFVNWPNPPTPETHLRLLAGSDRIVLAWDEATAQVVGFITAVTDGVLSAYIPHLEVLPAYQGQGIGQELMRRMLARLSSLYMVDLVCDPELESFYTRFGMRAVTGMVIRNYARQSGTDRDEEPATR